MTDKVKIVVDMISTFLPDLEIVIVEDCECIETPDGFQVFGLYDIENNRIFIAGENTERDIIFTIFHELFHVYQERTGLKTFERLANIFANIFCEVLDL